MTDHPLVVPLITALQAIEELPATGHDVRLTASEARALLHEIQRLRFAVYRALDVLHEVEHP